MREHWKPIPNYAGLYEASDRGNIRSIDHYQEYLGRKKIGRVLLQRPNPRGYPTVRLSKGNKSRVFSVHRLVLESFVGPRDIGQVCRHRDGDKCNNALYNIVWGTPKENCIDKIRHGTIARGARNAATKLSEDDVREVRTMLAEGVSLSTIGRVKRVSYVTIRAIRDKETWAWL